MFLRLYSAAYLFNKKNDKMHRSTLIAIRYLGKSFPHYHTNSQFLAQFSDKTLFWRFTFFYLPTRKFPFSMKIATAPARNEYASPPSYNGCGNCDRFHPHDSLTLDAPQ